MANTNSPSVLAQRGQLKPHARRRRTSYPPGEQDPRHGQPGRVLISVGMAKATAKRAPGAARGSSSYTSLQGVGRALEVLEAVADRPMRASEIAERLGLKWATAYRSLAHLCDARYLRKDEASGIYYIGPRMHL